MGIRKLNEKGKKDFHARFISLSYRNRGKVPRTQTKVNATDINPKKDIDLRPPIKIIINKKDIKRILVYSASIIREKPPLLYSVL